MNRFWCFPVTHAPEALTLVVVFLSSLIRSSAQVPPLNWHLRYTAPPGLSIGAVGFGNGRFIAPLNDGTILSSTDGIVWSRYFTGTSVGPMNYVNGVFYSYNFTSRDGLRWTSIPGVVPDSSNIAYGPNLFLGLSGNGLLSTPDGTTWIPRSSAWNTSGVSLTGITFGNGLFVIVGSEGRILPGGNYTYSGLIMTSADGFVWTFRRFKDSEDFRGIAYANGRFLASAISVHTIKLNLVSVDGVTWDEVPSSPSVFKAVNNVFISHDGAGFQTSTNGITWASEPFDPSGLLSAADVAFGNGTFVVVNNPSTVQASVQIWQSDSSPNAQPDPPTALTLGAYPGVTISGTVGKRYRLEFQDSHLSDGQWQPLTDFYLPASPWVVFDPHAFGPQPRFYRAVSE